MGSPGQGNANEMGLRLEFTKNLNHVTNKIHATSNIDEIMLDVSKDICALFNADRLTIYVDGDDKASLISKVKTGLNSFKDLKLPIAEQSIAGYAAFHKKLLNLKDVYDEQELAGYSTTLRFLQDVDKRTGYRTKQMLVAPIVDTEGGDLIGVMQVINNKAGMPFPSMVEEGAREGFSNSGQLFVATAYDGGPAPLDRFRLWIEGVEHTAGGALRGGNVVVHPWGPDTRLKGWVDLHTHPMSNLAFGGKLFHGAPDAGSLMPAVQMPWDPQCRFDNRAINIYEALSQDGPTHGQWPWTSCGNTGRWAAILALEIANDAHVSPPNAVGFPTFVDWPKWDDITHQKMWIDWIRRAWESGLRVMVALSHNNRLLAEVVTAGGASPISGVTNDKASSDLQIEEIKGLVAAHSDFMAVARSSADLQSIIQGGRLAVVLGVEIDKIGEFSPGVTEQKAVAYSRLSMVGGGGTLN